MKDIKDIMIKIHPEITGYKLSCIKCRNTQENFKDFKNMRDYMDMSAITCRNKEIVLDDYKCEKCGCNTFDIDTFLKIEIR